MFLYVMECGKYTKIGISKNPNNRRKQLQTSNPEPIELIYSVEIFQFAEYFEAVLHTAYKEFRKKGEWFELDDCAEGDLFERMIEIENMSASMIRISRPYNEETAKSWHDYVTSGGK